jgi:hypothetical protein
MAARIYKEADVLSFGLYLRMEILGLWDCQRKRIRKAWKTYPFSQ